MHRLWAAAPESLTARDVQDGLTTDPATTTVLTQTITGLASESWFAGGTNPRPYRRLSSVLSMLVGAFVGGVLVLHAAPTPALVLATVLLGAIAVTTHVAARSTTAEQWLDAPS